MRTGRNPFVIVAAGVLGTVAAFGIVGIAIALVTVDGISREVAGGVAGGVLIVGVYAFAWFFLKWLGKDEQRMEEQGKRREREWQEERGGEPGRRREEVPGTDQEEMRMDQEKTTADPE